MQKPKKLPTVIDLALMRVFQDLTERGQVPTFEEFSKTLGFANSSQPRAFLKGYINFPKKRIESTIKALSEYFNVREEYIRTGHGSMYKNNQPYMAEDSLPVVEEHENIFGIGRLKRFNELEEENKKLKEKLNLYEKIIGDKDEIIQLQRELLKYKPKTA